MSEREDTDIGMVERVARAMVAADSGPEGSPLFYTHLREFGDGYRSAARAAIAAMREPDDAMARKADGLTDLVGPYPEANTPESRQDEFKCAWRAMIDKALEVSQE